MACMKVTLVTVICVKATCITVLLARFCIRMMLARAKQAYPTLQLGSSWGA